MKRSNQSRIDELPSFAWISSKSSLFSSVSSSSKSNALNLKRVIDRKSSTGLRSVIVVFSSCSSVNLGSLSFRFEILTWISSSCLKHLQL